MQTYLILCKSLLGSVAEELSRQTNLEDARSLFSIWCTAKSRELNLPVQQRSLRGRDAKPQERGIQSLPVCVCLATKPDFSLRRLRLIVLTRYLEGGVVRPDRLHQPWKMSLRRSVQCCRQQYHNCGHVCSICLHKSHRITLLLFTHSLERFQDHNCP